LAKSVPIAPFDSAGAIALPCFLLVIAFLAEPLPTSLAPFGFGFAFAGVAAFGLGVAFGFAFSVAAAFGFDCVAPPPVRLPAQSFSGALPAARGSFNKRVSAATRTAEYSCAGPKPVGLPQRYLQLFHAVH
jgi:hypothetical protein